VQSDPFNLSLIRTVLVAVVSSNTTLADAPGNVFLPKRQSHLSRDSVVNVSQVLTLDRAFLTERIGKVPPKLMSVVDEGLRLVLGV
jgi:mRNA interferase MazF